MLSDLPPHVLQRVVECVDSSGSTAALAVTCKDTLVLARERLNKERSTWNDLLLQAGQPFSASNEFASKLDDTLCRFVLFDAQTVDLPGLDSVERKWLHLRAGSIGLKSRTHKRKKLGLGTLQLSKPPGWTLPTKPLPPVKTPAIALRDARAARKAAWTTTCNECSCNLDADNALYHYSGMGPLCEECIEADPELDGLKWEAKSDFWC